MKRRLFQIALFVNAAALATLAFYTFTDLYSLQSSWVWLNPDEHYYGIRPVVTYALVAGVILPVFIVLLFRRKYLWLLQTLSLIVIATYYQSDILQKTLFVNQPTSAYSVNEEVRKITEAADKDIHAFAESINRRHPASVSQPDINAYTRQKPFFIPYIEMKNGRVFTISITARARKDRYFSYHAKYYPDGWRAADLSNDMVPELGTQLYVRCCQTYFKGGHWWITLSDPGMG